MKPALNFLVEWGSDKTKAWSGTNYSIFKALSKSFDITDYNLPEQTRLDSLIDRLTGINGLSIHTILRQRKSLKTISGTTFQFSEILLDTPDRPTYIYQDLSVNYLMDAKTGTIDAPGFKYSGFASSERAIRVRNSLQTEYYQSCKGIFTMGKWHEKYLKNVFPDFAHKIHHVGAGINVDRFLINNSEKKQRRILFIGRDFKRKGGTQVIEAFKLLSPKIPGLELHIAGPEINPNTEGIDSIYHYGDASGKTLSELFNKCDVFCMPSHFEAYGLVFIEALCFGLPCIGRNRYEMPYFIEEGITGELVETESPQELAEKIEKILKNGSYSENVKKRRDYYLSEYNWDSVAKRMTDIITSSQ